MTAKSTVLAGQIGNEVWVRVEGRGTFQVSTGLKEYAKQMIQRGHRRFVVDLVACELMDSTFMGTLAGIALRLREIGSGELSVVHSNDRNRSLLENLGLDHLFAFTLEGTPQVRPDIVPVESPRDAAATRTTMAEAHRALVEADPENEAKFRDVLELLEKERRDEDT